jgi:oxaloacetate decarboxylase (Na+ extruding) subunit alpha
MTTVRLVDTSTRDGNQSLWGATGLTTGMVEAVGPSLERAGFVAIDFTSSTHLSVGVRWHHEDPWERIRRMRAVVPTTPLSLITTGMRFMAWDRSPEAVMRLSMRSLAKHGMRRLQILEPSNDAAAASKVAQLAKEEGIEIVVAAVTFTESPVHTDSLYREAAAKLAKDPAIDVVYLKDPGGLLTLERTATLIPELRAAVGDTPLELHSHCTTGIAPQVYVLAAQLGIDVLHTAIGALSNGTSQPSATKLVENLNAVGIAVDVDLEAIAEAERLVGRFADTQHLEPGRPLEYDLSVHRHQVPGGMMATLRRQMAELRRPELFPRVLEEVALVRAELGYPIMVTPYSQFVGSQAVLNVMSVQAGQPRWSQLPDEIIRYVLGHFGPPPGPIADVVLERVTSAPRTKELDQPLPDPTIDELRERVASSLGHQVDDDEVVLRLVLPGEQLDAIKRPAPTWHDSPDSANTFIDGVNALPKWRSISVTRGTERIVLNRAASSQEAS